MSDKLEELLAFVAKQSAIRDKSELCKAIVSEFKLTKDRSVYACPEFAIRFSSSASANFGNTVLGLSKLQKYDDRPFLVCLVTPQKNYLLLANTSLLRKISHSLQQLREDNIRGSFNGTDIDRRLNDIDNVPENFPRLFDIHAAIGFEGNLARLVESTNNISPTGVKFSVSNTARTRILSAPARAVAFLASSDAKTLKAELDDRVAKHEREIFVAAMIENVNIRGRVIEYLIAGEDDALRDQLVAALRASAKALPAFKTENQLGDFTRDFDNFHTETDVKTKIMILNSNPKAYNIDKMLEFLARDRSVFLFYFVGIDPGKKIKTVLVSMFQEQLLEATILLKHWAGRNSRGVTQFEGRAIHKLILNPALDINLDSATSFLRSVIDL